MPSSDLLQACSGLPTVFPPKILRVKLRSQISDLEAISPTGIAYATEQLNN